MGFLFWLALIVGGGLFLLSLAGDILGIEGHGADALHSDVGVHGDTEWGRVFSLRNATYFLFAFGGVGVGLSSVWQGAHPFISVAAAIATGALAWTMSLVTFKYLKRTESGSRMSDRELVGRVGEVTLPIQKDGTGKILITKGGHTEELLARPLELANEDPESWRSVIVVEVEDGVAVVSPYAEDTDPQ